MNDFGAKYIFYKGLCMACHKMTSNIGILYCLVLLNSVLFYKMTNRLCLYYHQNMQHDFHFCQSKHVLSASKGTERDTNYIFNAVQIKNIFASLDSISNNNVYG